MIVGHYATALVAKERLPAVPLWYFLLAASVIDWLMLTLSAVGIERLVAGQLPGDTVMQTMVIDMTYSHDIIPVVVWAALAGLLGFVITRNMMAGIWGAGLVIFHEVCDLVAGFHHYIFGPETAKLGLAGWVNFPFTAFLIELALCFVCVWWYTTRMPTSPRNTRALYIVFTLGVLLSLPLLLPLPFKLSMLQ